MKNFQHNKIAKGLIISFCILLIIYFGMSAYFMRHFYIGSSINCISVSGKTVKQAEEELPSRLQTYTLSIKEQGGKTEQIKASDIGLSYNPNGQVQKLKEKQNPFGWIFAFADTKESEIIGGISYNEELLKKQLDNLNCIKSSSIVEPKNPGFVYTNYSYTITPEVKGSKINYKVLLDYAEKTISRLETTIDLEAAGCYLEPEYTSNSQKVINTKNLLDKYVSSKITYTFGENSEILDGSTINKWISIDNSLNVTLDEKKVKSYLSGLSNTYDTVGKTRSFVTSSGKTINISGGDYGWLMNTFKEAQNLISLIKDGKTVSKKPSYVQTAFSYNKNDIGNTYVEIDLSKQHLWFYKNGSLVVQGSVVTGNINLNHGTPPGIYYVKYKQKNAILKGPDYAAPVTYWMPFNNGIGIHDASWRSSFGGSIYKTNGSHGCVNAPYYLAKAVFGSIKAGDPVVCY